MAVKTSAQEIIGNIEKVKTLLKSNGSDSEDLAEELDWKVSRARLYKHKLSNLPSDELEELKEQDCEINEDVLGAICLAPPETRVELISRLCSIQEAAHPLISIDEVISELEEEHPLEKLSNEYWLQIGDYLKDRSISHYAFNSNAINFIRSIGYNGGFKDLSEKQKSWIIDLMEVDKNEVVTTEIFTNKELLKNELESDYKIISKFFKCL